MGITYNSSIVKSGLVLYLDAANRRSYPGTGTTWTDLSGNSNNGTLTNGPTFSSSNNGNITFDGTNDGISIGAINLTSTNKISVDFFCKILNYRETLGSSNLLFECTDNFNNSTTGLIAGFGDDSNPAFRLLDVPQYPIVIGVRGDVGYNLQAFSKTLVNDLQWHHWVCIFDKSLTGTKESKLYIDGVLRSQSFNPGFDTNNTNNFGNNTWFIGARNASSVGSNVQIGNFKVYNRELSATEIRQNFEAHRDRYGI